MELKALLGFSLMSFIVTYLVLPSWIHRAKIQKFVGIDSHKKGALEVSEMGGLAVILGVTLSLFFYIALETFMGDDPSSAILIFAALSSLLIATIIGMTDDILGSRLGLNKSEKILLTFLVPVPIMVVNAGTSTMGAPFYGAVNLGLLYPLVVIPVGIIGATNGFNMLAGYNGLEAGMGVAILSTLGYLAWKVDAIPATVIAFCFIGSLIAFLYYNKYPSRVFPGDVLTYPIGATIAVIAILSNIERVALILFFPYYIELILKVRGRFRVQSDAQLLEDGSLENINGWYSLPHIAISFLKRIKGKAIEKEIVLVIFIFELLFVSLSIITFNKPII